MNSNAKRLREIADRAATIEKELDKLYRKPVLTNAEAERADALEAEVQVLSAEADQVERQIISDARQGLNGLSIERGYDAPGLNRNANPWEGGIRGEASELRSRAVAAIEQMQADVSDDVRSNVVEAIEEQGTDANSALAKLTLATTTDAYRTAFIKGLAGEQHLWSDAERAAVREVRELRTAMSLTDKHGGYGVPVHLDPTVNLTNDGGANPLVNEARVVRITSNEWNGLTSAGVTASWDAEMAEVSDDSPEFGQPVIKAHKAQAWVEGSIEVIADFRSLEAEVMAMFADAKNRLEGAAFTTGAGDASNQPTGLITALTTIQGTPQVIDSETPGVFAAEDVYKLADAMAPRFEANAVLMGTANTQRTIKRFFNPSGDEPDVLATVGARFVVNPNMQSAADIEDAGDYFILLMGDLKATFTIVQRVGMAVEFVPVVMGENQRPTGKRGWYAHWRTGSGVVVPNGSRLLKVTVA